MLFCYLESFRRCRKKNESEGEVETLAALFFEHERKPAVRIREYVDQVVANLSLVYKDKERHASNDWTNHTISHANSSYYSLRKQKRLLPMLFQPFQPSLTRGEKVEQPNQP